MDNHDRNWLQREIEAMYAEAQGDPLALRTLDYLYNEETNVDRKSLLEEIGRLPSFGEFLAQLEAELAMASEGQPVGDEPVIIVEK